MDPAVALTRAYLQLNGFFVMTEYPVMESMASGGTRPTTDLDILAVRFNNTGHFVSSGSESGAEGRVIRAADPALDVGRAELDFIIGEVKQGTAELNRTARDPGVLRAALIRFGAFNPDAIDHVVDTLVRKGESRSRSGRARVRLFAFGSSNRDRPPRGVATVLHRDMVESLRGAIRNHSDLILAADIKDEALAMMSLLTKARAWDTQPSAATPVRNEDDQA